MTNHWEQDDDEPSQADESEAKLVAREYDREEGLGRG